MDGSEAEKTRIIPRLIEEEMKSDFLDYAMSVIVSRALPDVRDGLKPVHRRILFAMNELGLAHNKPFKKSARVVGEVMGKYHPHGDVAIYDTIVRMAQDFSLRYPLVDGQGNFGSVDGDAPAAMRYTECRLRKISEEILEDIDKNTVNFRPNFDETLKEPEVLPSKFPNLLANGSSGIAVGMATNIPPHNIKELCEGVKFVIDNPDSTPVELLKFVKGPDFPTGGIILGTSGIKQAYLTGKGKLLCRAKIHTEEVHKREALIVTEIPYMVNKAEMLEHIGELIKEKKVQGIHDIRDESDKDGMRVVIELKSDASTEVVQNQLLKHSRLQMTFGINMVCLVNNEPRLLNLKEIITYFIEHRKEVVTRRTQFELKKAEQRAHILTGLLIALKNIDDVVKKIKASKDVESAKHILMHDYSLSEEQSKAILDMRLQKLASLEQEKIKNEYDELMKLIAELKEILASPQRILDIIKKELDAISETYGDERKTEISHMEVEEDIDIEELIEEGNMTVTISHQGYIKRVPTETYKQQRRGGKGIIGTTTKEDDFTESLFTASTHAYILFFTNKGIVHWLKVYQIPEASRQAKGRPIIQMINIGQGEKISAFVPVEEFAENKYLVLVTKNGTIKKTPLSAFSNVRKTGIRAINLDENDDLIQAVITSGKDQIIIATANGMAVRFDENDVRPMGRTAGGVRGIKLKGNDEVIGMVIADDNDSLLSITENGYGKRTKVSEYRLISRGGSGVINIQTTERNGKVCSINSVKPEDEIIVISKNGIIMRTMVREISEIGRNTQGVKIMSLGQGDKVAAVSKVIQGEE